jgi:hypothetical protein
MTSSVRRLRGALLVARLHVDLQRVASATCRFGR